MTQVTPSGCFIYHSAAGTASGLFKNAALFYSQTSTSHAPKLSKTSKNLFPFWFPCLSHPSRSTLCFPSSLWMAFPGLQRTQETESVIVYVSAESMTTVFFYAFVSPYLTIFLAGKQNRGTHCWVCLTADSALGPKKGQGVGLVLQELTWTQLILKN